MCIRDRDYDALLLERDTLASDLDALTEERDTLAMELSQAQKALDDAAARSQAASARADELEEQLDADVYKRQISDCQRRMRARGRRRALPTSNPC